MRERAQRHAEKETAMPALPLSSFLRRRPLAASLLTVACAFPAAARAGTGVWTPLGPDGGTVTALVADPRASQTVLAGTATAGVFRSTDGGATWTASNQGMGLPGQVTRVNALRLDPLRPERAYAVTDGSVFKSADGGRSWAAAARGLPSAVRLLSLAIDPHNSNRLYLGAARGIYRSLDAGATWQRPSPGTPTANVRALAVDPRSGDLYAGTDSDGVLASTDGGSHWRALAAGLPAGTVAALEVDSTRAPSLLFAGASDGLYRADIRGRRWVQVGAPALAGPVDSLAFDGRTGRFYAGTEGAGVFASDDRGATWRAVSEGLEATDPVLALAAGTAGVFAGTRGTEGPGGVFASTDRGAHWRPRQKGLSALAVRTLAASPRTPGLLLASAGADGLFRTRDGGQSWQRLPGFPASASAYEIAFDPFNPTTVYAVSAGDFATVLLRSGDLGGTWQALIPGGARGFAYLWPDRAVPGTLWGAGSGLFRSDDRGTGFALVPLPGFDFLPRLSLVDLQSDLQDPQTLYAAGGYLEVVQAGISSPRLWRSTDGGRTWQRKEAGLPYGYSVGPLAIDPTAPSHLYTTGGFDLFRSRDRGDSWEPVLRLFDHGYPIPLVLTATHPAILYAATNAPQSGIQQSHDDGATWEPANAGLGIARRVTALVADPHAPRRIYAATGNGGVFSFAAPE
jgi:photosystem II stability/assembly factor-like uncharacterized protein